MSTPFTLAAYRVAGQALRPLAGAWLQLRVRNGKEDPARLGERFGHATQTRPDGPLVWLHGASVGETRVLLSVRDGLAAQRPDLSFLITTGTRTAANIVASERHPRTRHQFAIIDQDGPARRFLDHWRPDLGVFAESEVWPNLILEAKRRGVPLALINACMGEKSLANWARAPETAARVFSCFDLIMAADKPTASGLEHILRTPVLAAGNLKLAAAAAAPDADELARWRALLGDRKVWLAASTHQGEEEIIIEAHAGLRAKHPDALLILAPRHPDRGPAVSAQAGNAPRRSLGAQPAAEDSVFIVDTMGELGLFMALAPIVFMGGSLLPPLEGHNPIEPSLIGAAVIVGPYVSSFAEVYGALAQANALTRADDAMAIAGAIDALWRDEPARAAQVSAAQATLRKASPGLDQTITALLGLMKKPHAAHAPA